MNQSVVISIKKKETNWHCNSPKNNNYIDNWGKQWGTIPIILWWYTCRYTITKKGEPCNCTVYKCKAKIESITIENGERPYRIAKVRYQGDKRCNYRNWFCCRWEDCLVKKWRAGRYILEIHKAEHQLLY